MPEDMSDNESLRTSLPRQSPTPSVVSTTIMTTAEDEIDEPPPYTAIHPSAPEPPGSVPSSWQNRDPRSASTQSLVPDESPEESGRRKLLLVYIHGFMGSETSFRSFPAHVHNLLAVLLAESHVVHTKIYPKYRSKKSLNIAAQQFSDWLEPHVSPITDVVLLGHSMGGLLASDIVLLPAAPHTPSQGPLRNRYIVGTINFDVPFLGMHPGVIASGIGSLFRPGQKSPASEQPPSNDTNSLYSVTSQGSSSSDLRVSSPADPNYNPAYTNDNILPTRSGLSNAAHFIKKHSKNLRQATKTLVTNHVEFGGAMADYEGLKTRYTRIRMLEEESGQARATVVRGDRPPPRVRFTNYYTASTGRPKKLPQPTVAPEAELSQAAQPVSDIPAQPGLIAGDPPSFGDRNRDLEAEPEPEGLPPAYSDIDFTDSEDDDFSDDLEQLGRLDPIDSTETLESIEDVKTAIALQPMDSSDTDYKPMPSLLPPAPPIFRPPFNALKDKEAIKAAYKEYKRQVRDHHRQIIAYHQSLVEYRKQEIGRLKKYHKASVENLQATFDSRCNELTLRREQRRAEFEARREKLKQRIDEAKERRKTERETIREARKAKANKAATASVVPASNWTQEIQKAPEKAPIYPSDVKSPPPLPTRAPPQVPAPTGREARREARAACREARTEYKADRRLHRVLDRVDRREARSERRAGRHAQAAPYFASDEKAVLGKGKNKDKAEAFPAHSEAGDTVFDMDAEQAPHCEDLSNSDAETTPSGRILTPETSPGSSRRPSVAPSLAPSFVATVSSPPTRSVSATSYPNEKAGEKATKPKKDRKFCVLPPKDASGNRDPTWVRIYMEGVDEIGAHCGLFFTRGSEGQESTNADLGEAGSVTDDVWSERYAGLVGDVAERIEGWCLEGLTERMVRGVEAL